jgi:hypothetical protein
MAKSNPAYVIGLDALFVARNLVNAMDCVLRHRCAKTLSTAAPK